MAQPGVREVRGTFNGVPYVLEVRGDRWRVLTKWRKGEPIAGKWEDSWSTVIAMGNGNPDEVLAHSLAKATMEAHLGDKS